MYRIVPVLSICAFVALVGPAAASVTVYDCAANTICNESPTIGTTGFLDVTTVEFRGKCTSGKPPKVQNCTSRGTPNVTCTATFGSSDYLTCSCTNWSTSDQTVGVTVECKPR